VGEEDPWGDMVLSFKGTPPDSTRVESVVLQARYSHEQSLTGGIEWEEAIGDG